MNTQQFFRYLKGKTVAFCGVGRTHMPLIKLFQEKGAVVSVRDQRPLEKLGENGEILRSLGVELRLGEDYLQDLTRTSSSAHRGMRYHLPQLEEAGSGAAPSPASWSCSSGCAPVKFTG